METIRRKIKRTLAVVNRYEMIEGVPCEVGKYEIMVPGEASDDKILSETRKKYGLSRSTILGIQCKDLIVKTYEMPVEHFIECAEENNN